MQRRQPSPSLWLMTDERMGERLWTALDRLPRGGGVVFRHYGLEAGARRALFAEVRKIARRRGLVLLLAGSDGQARAWRADGSHNRDRLRQRGGLRSAPVHSLLELARHRNATLFFVSPLYPTRSHPDTRPLGAIRFASIARRARGTVVALGGMDSKRGRNATALGADGWAAIDAWSS